MAKDKIYGFGLALISLIFLILYTIWVPLQVLAGDGGLLVTLGVMSDTQALQPLFLTLPQALAIPNYMGTLMICLVMIWIGWTMATTPPPEPIDLDSLTLDDDEEEKKEE
ncbi:MAG: hypothetical protein ACXAEU_09730 [Candidatus Hodarchaeales archaeon]|jgi:hypothetical protein